LTLFTRASTIWLRQRMISSRISTACNNGRVTGVHAGVISDDRRRPAAA
jgi:hypothetical protein